MNQPIPERKSQTQDISVKDITVGRDFIIAPKQIDTYIETQIVEISAEKITQQPLIKASPYKGLKRFNIGDREYFFGRDALIAKLFKAVNKSSFSLVLGASGSGKSSVVRAGLITVLKKSLESQKFYDFIFTPNQDPFESLYRCLLSEEKDYSFRESEAKIALDARPTTLPQIISTLKKDEERWLLFIDQFEQLFTICTDLEKRKNFIEGIVQVAKKGDSSVRIVLAMRSDFLEQFSFYPTLGAIANQNNIHNDELLKGSRLEQIVEFREENAFEKLGGLVKEENEFVDASVAEKYRGEKEKEEQRQRELEQERKARKAAQTRTGVAVIAAVIVSVVGFIAYVQQQEAKRQAQIATLGEKAAVIKTLLDAEPVTGLVMAIEATGTSQLFLNKILPQVESSLVEAINVARQRNLIELHQAVYSIAISADGQTLVSGGYDKTVRLWDKEGNFIREFQGHEEAVTSVAISEDGQTIVSGSDDKTVRLWDRKGKLIHTLRKHEDKVLSVAISADGQTIVSGGEDGTVRLWDRKGKTSGLSRAHEGRVLSVAISADGQTIVSGGQDETVRLWDRKDNTIRILGKHRGSVQSVDVSPDGQHIVSGGWDAAAHLWKRDEKLLHIFQESERVLSVAISSDGQTIAIGGGGGTVKLLDRYGNPIGKPFIGHEGYVSRGVNSVDISPDEQTLISGSTDGTIRFWDIYTGKTFGEHQDTARVAISSDGETIISSDGDAIGNRSEEGTIRSRHLLFCFRFKYSRVHLAENSSNLYQLPVFSCTIITLSSSRQPITIP